MDATNPVAQTPVSQSAGSMNIKRNTLKMDIQTPPEKHTFQQNFTSSPVNSEGSVAFEAGATNFSSANSTMKSDSSGGFGKKGRTSHQEAIATLDNFLNDVTIMTQEAKLQEEKKQLQKIEPLQISSKNKAVFRIGTSSSSGDMSKRWTSMPSVISDDFGESYSRCQKSLQDIRSIEYEVFSDEESEISAHEEKRKVHLRNQTNNVNQSVSSQGSDAIPSHSDGLSHLNHLCKFLEQFDQLQQQNSELSKRVSTLEYTFKAPSPVSTESRTATAPENGTSSRRYSAMFVPPKDKPKKAKTGKAEKIKGRTKYLASLPFVLAAKSVDNMKSASSQSDKPKLKISRQKKSPSYAADDIEIGKILHIQEQWRNSSVKSPSSKDAEKRFSDFEPEIVETEDTVDSPTQEVKEETIIPVVLVTEEASTSNHDDKISPVQTDQTSTGIKKVFPLRAASPPPRARSEERSYRNTKKMTEWGALQRAFPVPQMESNVDLLQHLESILSVNKQHSKKTTPYHGFKRHGRPKKGKNMTSNMFLPSTEIPGFASTVLAAHALANQLTLTLSSSDLELLSTPDTVSTTDQGFSDQTVRIT